MLARRHRLSSDFFRSSRRTFGRPQVVYTSEHFSYAVFSSPYEYGRCGIVAGMKFFPTHVCRNSVRRLFYAVCEEQGIMLCSHKIIVCSVIKKLQKNTSSVLYEELTTGVSSLLQ